MPTYIYETICERACDVRRFEIEQRMSEKPLATHPDSGEPIRRVITGGLGFTGVASRGGSPAAGGGCDAPGCGHTHH